MPCWPSLQRSTAASTACRSSSRRCRRWWSRLCQWLPVSRCWCVCRQQERMADTGKERRLLWESSWIRNNSKRIHLQAIVIVKCEMFVLNHSRIKLKSRSAKSVAAARMAAVEVWVCRYSWDVHMNTWVFKHFVQIIANLLIFGSLTYCLFWI